MSWWVLNRREWFANSKAACMSGTVTLQLVDMGGDDASEAGGQIVKTLDFLSQGQWGAIEGW